MAIKMKFYWNFLFVTLIMPPLGASFVPEQIEFPKVELTSVAFYTNHKFNSSSNSIFKTFQSLTFKCNASYPTTWKFFKPPYLDPALKGISITKWRNITSSSNINITECLNNDKNSTNCPSVFTSELVLDFKNVNGFSELLCRGSKGSGFKGRSTRVTASTAEDDPLQLQFNYTEGKFDDDYNKTEAIRIGTNSNCTLKLYFDLKKRTFDCGWMNTSDKIIKPIPKVINCKTKDECSSIFKPDTKNCNDATTPSDCSGCRFELKASKSPGIIACLDSNETQQNNETRPSYKYSIARTYIVSQDDVLYFGKEEPQDSSLSLTKNCTVVYRNETLQFTCKGTSSYYMNGFQFTLKVIDSDGSESTEYLGKGEEILNMNTEFVYTVTKNIQLNHTSIVPNSQVFVYCYAPVWDSFEWKSASDNFIVQEPEAPKIEKTTVECNGTNSSLIFECKASGKPRPAIMLKWSGSGKPIESTEVRAFNVSNDTVCSTGNIPYTYFPEHKIPDNLKTIVSCVATNFYGRDEHDGSQTTWKDKSCVLLVNDEDKTLLYCAIGLLAVGLVVSVGVGMYFTKRYRNRYFTLGDAEIEAFKTGDPSSDDAFLRPYKLEFEIPRDQIAMENTVIGEGQFAKVVFATWKAQKVAVKMVKKSADVKHFKSFLSEIKTMCYLEKHPNLVNIVGACTRNIKQRDVLLVIEYCVNGNLLKYLKRSQGSFIDLSGPEETDEKKRRLQTLRGRERRKVSAAPGPISTINLLTWAVQCASAMEYLSLKRLVHGDLAARNVLLTEQLHAKVGDFGLSKQLSEYSVYVQELTCPLPLRWMSLEALQDLEFSIQSDIWSYGVLLWEMFSLGQLPYPGIPQWDFQSYIFLQQGHRMDKPEYASASIYKIMRDCWEEMPEKRPRFEKLKEWLIAELIALQC